MGAMGMPNGMMYPLAAMNMGMIYPPEQHMDPPQDAQ